MEWSSLFFLVIAHCSFFKASSLRFVAISLVQFCFNVMWMCAGWLLHIKNDRSQVKASEYLNYCCAFFFFNLANDQITNIKQQAFAYIYIYWVCNCCTFWRLLALTRLLSRRCCSCSAVIVAICCCCCHFLCSAVETFHLNLYLTLC